MTEISAFQLSRIYASGWNAGRKHPFEDNSVIADLAESLNPHGDEPERARWAQGFSDAANRQISTAAGLRKR
jgi:hypothetical protein